MILDQIKRMEEHITKLEQQMLEHRRWSMYEWFRSANPSTYLRIYNIMDKIDEYWAKRLFPEFIPDDILHQVLYWIHVHKASPREINERFMLQLRDKWYDENIIRAVWKKLPMQELEKLM